VAATASPSAPSLQLLAAHGWGGQAASWEPWRQATAPLGWTWICQDRGYDGQPPMPGHWSADPTARRVVIGHSFGPHLLDPAVLAQAEAVVLLASFGRFLPPGPGARRLRVALDGMAAQLADGPEPEASQRAQAMLQQFLAQAALPDPPELMPLGPAAAPIPAAGRQRLRRDLLALEASQGLPVGFPQGVPVLIVEAGADRIVVPEARQLLRQALPQAEVLELAGAGHAFLRAAVVPAVLHWLQTTLASAPAPRPAAP